METKKRDQLTSGTIKIYEKLVRSIVHQMQNIIGDVAIAQANKVKGLKTNHKTKIVGAPIEVIENLLTHYTGLIGSVSITLSKKAIKQILKENKNLKVPEELRGD